jgi:hypothetical protein
MADIVKRLMEETGINVIELLSAVVEVARKEYPSELVRNRDNIIQGLYGGVPCDDCINMKKEMVASAGVSVAEHESQNSPVDKANFSSMPEVVMKRNSDQVKLILFLFFFS